MITVVVDGVPTYSLPWSAFAAARRHGKPNRTALEIERMFNEIYRPLIIGEAQRVKKGRGQRRNRRNRRRCTCDVCREFPNGYDGSLR